MAKSTPSCSLWRQRVSTEGGEGKAEAVVAGGSGMDGRRVMSLH